MTPIAPEGQIIDSPEAQVATAPAAQEPSTPGLATGDASAPTSTADAGMGQGLGQNLSNEEIDRYYQALMNGAPIVDAAPVETPVEPEAEPVLPDVELEPDPAPEPEPAADEDEDEPSSAAPMEPGRFKSRKVRPTSPEWDKLLGLMGRNPDLTPEMALAQLRGVENPAGAAANPDSGERTPVNPAANSAQILRDMSRLRDELKKAREDEDIIRVTELGADLLLAQTSLELAKADEANEKEFLGAFNASQAEAVRVYPDLAVENSAFRRRALELDDLYAESNNPLHRAIYDSPERPVLIAQQAAFSLEREGKAVRRGGQAAPAKNSVPAPAPKPAPANPVASGNARTSVAPVSKQDTWMQEFQSAGAIKQEEMLRAKGLLR